MIHSQVEILLVVKQERRVTLVTSCKSKQTLDVLDMNKLYVLYPSLPVGTEVSITEEILNQLKNEERLYEIA